MYVIQGIGMNIEFASVRVGKYEVTFPRALAGDLKVAEGGKEFTQLRNKPVRHGDVEVAARPGLLAQQSVHGHPPST